MPLISYHVYWRIINEGEHNQSASLLVWPDSSRLIETIIIILLLLLQINKHTLTQVWLLAWLKTCDSPTPCYRYDEGETHFEPVHRRELSANAFPITSHIASVH